MLLEKQTQVKRCDNCKYFNMTRGGGYQWCGHKDHEGVMVPNFTYCPEHEFKAVLEPCPFCGGEAEVIIKDWDNRADEYMAQCTRCGVRQKDYCADKEAVVGAWNRCKK